MRLSATKRILIVAALVTSASLYLTRVTRAEVVPPRETLAHMPMRVGRWTGHRNPDLTPAIVRILGIDDYVSRTYSASLSEPSIDLYVGYYKSQRQGDTMHSPLNCLPGAGWQPVTQERVALDVFGPPGARNSIAPIEVNRVVIEKGLERQLVLYWYQSPQRVVASEYWGKVYTVLDAVRYNRTDAAMVRVVTPIVDDVTTTLSAAEQRARDFVQAVFPLMRPSLPS